MSTLQARNAFLVGSIILFIVLMDGFNLFDVIEVINVWKSSFLDEVIKMKSIDSRLPSTKVLTATFKQVHNAQQMLKAIKSSISFFLPLNTLYIELVLATDADVMIKTETLALLDNISDTIASSMARFADLKLFPSVKVSKRVARTLDLGSQLLLDNDVYKVHRADIEKTSDFLATYLSKRPGSCRTCTYFTLIGTPSFEPNL